MSFYEILHTEKGSRSWLVSNSKTGTCRLSCEVNSSHNTRFHLQLLRAQKLREVTALLCCNSWFCSVLAQAHFTHFYNKRTYAEDTPLSAGRNRDWKQFLSRMFFCKGHCLPGSEWTDSGFALEEQHIIKCYFLPALAKPCVAPFHYLSSPRYRSHWWQSGKEADNPGGAQICYLELKFNYIMLTG